MKNWEKFIENFQNCVVAAVKVRLPLSYSCFEGGVLIYFFI